MIKIIRCVLPDGVHRFKPFTVADYRDFLLLRNHMEHLDETLQSATVDELLEDLFKEHPKLYRPYIFIKVFSGSIGSTKINLSYKCPICGKEQPKILNIAQDDFVAPELELGNVILKFKIPDEVSEDITQTFLDNIVSCTIKGNGDITYPWDDIDEESKDKIISSIDFEMIESINKKLHPVHFTIKFKCIETEQCRANTQTVVYNDIKTLFKLLVNPDEIFHFYDINHTLTKSNYDYGSIMDMAPSERSMILSFVERDKRNDSTARLS